MCTVLQMKIGFLFKKSWLGFGNLDLIFKVTMEHNCQIWAKNGLCSCYQYISQELMDGMLPNLHAYYWERTKSSLCSMICTTFSRSQQVNVKIATIEWFRWWRGDIIFTRVQWSNMQRNVFSAVNLSRQSWNTFICDSLLQRIVRSFWSISTTHRDVCLSCADYLAHSRKLSYQFRESVLHCFW